MNTHYTKDRCSQSVREQGSWPRYNQCSRKPWKDGFCKQHHPDTVAKRREESQRRWDKKQESSPWALLGRANERIIELEDLVAVLADEGTRWAADKNQVAVIVGASKKRRETTA